MLYRLLSVLDKIYLSLCFRSYHKLTRLKLLGMVNTVIHIRPLDQLNKKSLIVIEEPKTLKGVCESSQKKIQLIRAKANMVNGYD